MHNAIYASLLSLAGCSDGMADVSRGGWIGEDCIAGNAAADGYDRCHAARRRGGMWETAADLDAFDADSSDATTLFSDTSAAAGEITYILMGFDDYACWVWGEDVLYYDDYACTDVG